MKKIQSVLGIIFLLAGASCVNAQDFMAIKLPSPRLEKEGTLMHALQLRQSQRSFSDREITLEVLSDLLWVANGINRPEHTLRTVPSAHNWQGIDVYVAMRQGVYVYDVQSHSLQPVVQKDVRDDIGKQGFTKNAPLSFIFVADYAKMSDNEKDFYSATDAGFISQNVYLYCASEGLATVVLGFVDRKKLGEAMGLRKEQHIILTQPIGYPRE